MAASCWRRACACAASVCARASASARTAASSCSRWASSALSRMRCSRSASAAARCCSMASTRRSRSAWSRSMRWKAASAPRRRSSRPASSAVTCAASCCKPSRFWRSSASCACNSSSAASAVRVLSLQPQHLLALLFDGTALGLARILVARGLRGPLLQAPLHALRPRPPSASAPRPGWPLRSPPGAAPRCVLPAAPSVSSMAAGQRRGFGLRLRQPGLQLSQPVLRLAQLALQRQWPFAGRLAARHRCVVEALAHPASERTRVHAAKPAAWPPTGLPPGSRA